MLIAQVSDPHVMCDDDPMWGFVDSRARLAGAVEALLTGLPCPPDLVLLTGDLVNRGTDAEYDLLLPLLAPLDDAGVPLLAVPGNHDERGAFRRAFAGRSWLPDGAPDAPVDYVVDDLPVRIVAMDSTVPGRDDGELDDDQLAWLDDALDRGPARPTLLCLHHPPYRTGMWWMDYGGCKGAFGLRQVLERHPEVVRVVAGHVHRTSTTTWGPTVLSTAPSPFYTTTPGVPGVVVPQVVDRPAPIPLLVLHDDRTWVTAELDPPGPATALDLPALIGERWDDYERRARSGATMPSHR